MNNIIDLDDVMISPLAQKTWQEFARRVAAQLRLLGVTDPSQVPDEQARVNPDGTLTVFVTLPNGEVSMEIPKEQWAYRQKH